MALVTLLGSQANRAYKPVGNDYLKQLGTCSKDPGLGRLPRCGLNQNRPSTMALEGGLINKKAIFELFDFLFHLFFMKWLISLC